MLKKIFLSIIILTIPIFAQILKFDENTQKIINNAGIHVVNISSMKYGNIKNTTKKSLVVFAKIKLENDISKYKIFDVYESKQKFANNQTNLTAILVITENNVDILSEWVCKTCNCALNDFYQDPIEVISAKKVSKLIPNLLSKKIPNNQEGIIVPTEAGIDTYVFWYANHYSVYVPDEIP